MTMEPVEEGKASLLAGIESDVHAEERQIIEDAEKQAADKRKYAQKKAESILNDARKKAQEQAELVKKKVLSDVGLEIKRRSMRVRDQVIREIMNRVEQKLRSMIGEPDYASILTDWITEAAIGLNADSAQVNASEAERPLIDERLLSEAGRRIHRRLGREVTLTLDDSRPLKAQGVLLTAADGRTAFNNQVKTRILRKDRRIRALTYETLFTENRNE